MTRIFVLHLHVLSHIFLFHVFIFANASALQCKLYMKAIHEYNSWWCLWKYLWSLCADGEMWWWHRLAGPGHDVWWLLSMTSPAHSLPTDDIIQTSHATRPLPPSLTAHRNKRHGQCHKSFKCRLYEGSRRFQNNGEGPYSGLLLVESAYYWHLRHYAKLTLTPW